MNITKPTVIGIDIPIQKFQTVLYNKILSLWPVDDTSFNMYGRAYRNEAESGAKGYEPQIYVGNNEYQDTYPDDTLKGSAFFGLTSPEKVTADGDTTAQVFIIFMVKLDQIKPGPTRNDEEVRNDIQQICLNRISGFFMTEVVTGIDQVFKGYNIANIKFRDMYPWHCFRLNFNLTYNIYDCVYTQPLG